MSVEGFAAILRVFAAMLGLTYHEPAPPLWPQGQGEQIVVQAMSWDPRDFGMPKETKAYVEWRVDHWLVSVDARWLEHASSYEAMFVAAHEAYHAAVHGESLKHPLSDKKALEKLKKKQEQEANEGALAIMERVRLARRGGGKSASRGRWLGVLLAVLL